MQNRLREVTPFSDRKGLWGRRVSGLFFLQTDREKEGELFLCFGDKRRPFFSLSFPVELTPSTSFPSLLPLALFESVTHTYVDTQDTQYFVVFFPLCVIPTAPPCWILYVLEIALPPPHSKQAPCFLTLLILCYFQVPEVSQHTPSHN